MGGFGSADAIVRQVCLFPGFFFSGERLVIAVAAGRPNLVSAPRTRDIRRGHVFVPFFVFRKD